MATKNTRQATRAMRRVGREVMKGERREGRGREEKVVMIPFDEQER